MKLIKFCFAVLHASVFVKVRELVDEIKYAFVVIAYIRNKTSIEMRIIYPFTVLGEFLLKRSAINFTK